MDLNDPAALERRMRAWYGPPDVTDPPPAPAAIAMPRALRSWYEIAGRWTGARGGPDLTRVMSPDELYVEDGRLVFMTEYIGDFAWATDPTGDDPPVYDREDDEAQWQALAPSLSAFLQLFWVLNAILAAPAQAIRAAEAADDLIPVRSRLQAIATVHWRWPFDVLTFYEADGMLAYIVPAADGGGSVTVATNTLPPGPAFEAIAPTSWHRTY